MFQTIWMLVQQGVSSQRQLECLYINVREHTIFNTKTKLEIWKVPFFGIALINELLGESVIFYICCRNSTNQSSMQFRGAGCCPCMHLVVNTKSVSFWTSAVACSLECWFEISGFILAVAKTQKKQQNANWGPIQRNQLNANCEPPRSVILARTRTVIVIVSVRKVGVILQYWNGKEMFNYWTD